ncbi:hypothetical protein DPMN_150310 [Dreissena polymorpha]|uniref:Uncharacterized protein n=1 Tax=Dreissena polymorpha TaxID=45954 RepID=A0A9D4FHS0_DREPO|nr:hypothetical protein DPMN_150310 [Dreissena polymorpha]
MHRSGVVLASLGHAMLQFWMVCAGAACWPKLFGALTNKISLNPLSFASPKPSLPTIHA